MEKTYKICLLEQSEFLQDEGERNTISTLNYKPKLSSNLEIDGELYHVTSIYERGGMVGVRRFEFNEEVDEELAAGNLTCPYCGYEDYDSFELSDDGEADCGRCGSEMEFERVVEITYVSKPKKKNETLKI